METSNEVFFDIEQLSEIMGVKCHTLRDMVKHGNYPPPCIGEFNRHFWRMCDIELLIRLIVAGIWKPDSLWDDLMKIHSGN